MYQLIHPIRKRSQSICSKGDLRCSTHCLVLNRMRYKSKLSIKLLGVALISKSVNFVDMHVPCMSFLKSRSKTEKWIQISCKIFISQKNFKSKRYKVLRTPKSHKVANFISLIHPKSNEIFN